MSSPRNLALITPAYMGFEILSGADEAMFPGQIIEYYVRPVAGIKLHWVTEITHVEHLRYFVDEQRFGPYAFWHHKHFFKPVPQGVEMRDVVHYKLPMGFLGNMANGVFVKKQLQEIFDFRFKAISELF